MAYSRAAGEPDPAVPGDFAVEAFRFGLSTVLDGIACRA